MEKTKKHRAAPTTEGQELAQKVHDKMQVLGIKSRSELARKIDVSSSTVKDILFGLGGSSTPRIRAVFDRFLNEEAVMATPPFLRQEHGADPMIKLAVDQVRQMIFVLSWLVHEADEDHRKGFRHQLGRCHEQFTNLSKALTNEMMRESVLRDQKTLTEKGV